MAALCLTLHFVRREMSDRYLGSFSGRLWALFQPLIQLALYRFVFADVSQPLAPPAFRDRLRRVLSHAAAFRGFSVIADLLVGRCPGAANSWFRTACMRSVVRGEPRKFGAARLEQEWTDMECPQSVSVLTR